MARKPTPTTKPSKATPTDPTPTPWGPLGSDAFEEAFGTAMDAVFAEHPELLAAMRRGRDSAESADEFDRAVAAVNAVRDEARRLGVALPLIFLVVEAEAQKCRCVRIGLSALHDGHSWMAARVAGREHTSTPLDWCDTYERVVSTWQLLERDFRPDDEGAVAAIKQIETLWPLVATLLARALDAPCDTHGIDPTPLHRAGIDTTMANCCEALAVVTRLRGKLERRGSDATPPPEGTNAPTTDPDLLARLQSIIEAIESLGGRDDDKAPPPKLPELQAHDRRAWQLSLIPGMTQTEIAAKLNAEYPGKKWSQPRVHEAIRRAKAHAEASGLADIAARALPRAESRAPARTMDPAAADRGQRTDGRAAHLREKAREIAREE